MWWLNSVVLSEHHSLHSPADSFLHFPCSSTPCMRKVRPKRSLGKVVGGGNLGQTQPIKQKQRARTSQFCVCLHSVIFYIFLLSLHTFHLIFDLSVLRVALKWDFPNIHLHPHLPNSNTPLILFQPYLSPTFSQEKKRISLVSWVCSLVCWLGDSLFGFVIHKEVVSGCTRKWCLG